MERAKGIIIPIEADLVLGPQVVYGEPMTAICFSTEDDQFGRITFENLDSIKVSRGEIIPYKEDSVNDEPYCWVLKVENSNWQRERFQYEKQNYGNSYEFGGNVNEMLTDFSHYVFRFHDQFVEAISRGFWYEKSNSSLFGKALTSGHPFLPLTENNPIKIEAYNLICHVRINPTPLDELIFRAKFCSQKLIEFALELDGKASVDHTLVLSYRNGKLISTFRGYFGKQEKVLEGVGTLDDVRREIEKYMKEVYDRRKKMGN